MHTTTVCYNVWNNNGQDEWTYSIAEAMAMYADWSTDAPDTTVSLYVERGGTVDHASWLRIAPITDKVNTANPADCALLQLENIEVDYLETEDVA